MISCGIAMRSFEGIMFLQVLWSQFLVLSIAMQSGAAPVAQRKRRIPSPESVSQRLAASPGGKAPGFTRLVLPELAVVCGCSLVLQLESVRGPGSSLPSAVQGWVCLQKMRWKCNGTWGRVKASLKRVDLLVEPV